MPTPLCTAPHARSRRSRRPRLSLCPILLLSLCLLSTPLLLMAFPTMALAGDTGYTVTDANGRNVTGTSWDGSSIFPPDFRGNTVHIFSAPGSAERDPGSAFGGLQHASGSDARAPVQGNRLTITGGKMKFFVGGGVSRSLGAVIDNHVVFSGGTANTIAGGYIDNTASSADITGNSVTLSGSALLTDSLFGAYHEGSGTVSGNSVTLSGNAVVNGNIYGGHNEGNAAVSGNSVSITGGSVVFYVYGGKSIKGAREVTGNTVTITGGNLSKRVFGGQADNTAHTGTVSNNTVIISGGTVGGQVLGGESLGSGPVTGNKVIISGTPTLNQDAVGGYSSLGNATYNEVRMEGGTVVALTGGTSSTRDTTHNTVTITGGTIERSVYGGAGENGAIAYNTVHITGGTVVNRAYGGRSLHSGTVTGNKVIISGAGTISTEAIGGYAGSGDATYNEVRVEGGVVTDVVGGRNVIDNAAYNEVRVTGGSVRTIMGGQSSSRDAIRNTVTITGGTIWGSVYGGQSERRDATHNTVDISGNPDFNNSISFFGGFSQGAGDARTGNTLHLKTKVNVQRAANFEHWNFTLRDSFKGQTMLTVANAAELSTSTSTKARIDLSVAADSGRLLKGESFTLINKFSGTYAYIPDTAIQQGADFVGLYDFNVTDTGGNTNLTATVTKAGRAGGFGNDNIYTVTAADAGLDFVAGGVADGVGTTTATGNTLVLAGSPGSAVALYGGYTAPNPGGMPGDVRTGNTLAVHGLNFSARSVQNFQNYRFYLPASTRPGDVMLSVSQPTDLRGSGVDVELPPGGTGLAGGDSVTLIKSTAGLTANAASLTPDTSMQGISVLRTFDLSATGTELKAILRNPAPNPDTVNISQGQTVSTAVMGLGSTLIADGGMSSAMAATGAEVGTMGVGWTREQGEKGGTQEREGQSSGQSSDKDSGQKSGLSGGSSGGGTYGLVPFAAVSGGSLHYKVGDGADVKGLALMTGLAKRWRGDSADVLLGAFFETGFGGISNYTSSKTGTLTGTTNADYLGGGILARTNIKATPLHGLYAEASVRMGHMNQKYNNYDLRSANGRAASYELGATYYGLHASLGYIWTFNESLNLDLSTTYFWNHQQGGDVRIVGDPYSFGAVDSHRARASARLNYAVSEKFTAYAGAAWDHEFDGKANVTAYGLSMPSPTARGSTGVGELGLRFKPFANTGGMASTFTMDLNVQGFVGMREGIMGNFMLGWEF